MLSLINKGDQFIGFTYISKIIFCFRSFFDQRPKEEPDIIKQDSTEEYHYLLSELGHGTFNNGFQEVQDPHPKTEKTKKKKT